MAALNQRAGYVLMHKNFNLLLGSGGPLAIAR